MIFSISWSREEVESGGSTFLNDNLMKHNPSLPLPATLTPILVKKMPLVKHKISLKNIQMALGEITCNEISVQQATPPPFSFTMLAYLLFLFDLKSNSDIFLISFVS